MKGQAWKVLVPFVRCDSGQHGAFTGPGPDTLDVDIPETRML